MASETVSGTVSSSSSDPTHVFQGNETLEVSAVNAARMDASSISLGEQKIALHQGQSFPIQFLLSYDKSRAGGGYLGLVMNAKIVDENGHILYMNDTNVPVVNNVTVNVIKV